MKKKIIAIGIIALFLLMGFSTSIAITEEESEENIESEGYKGGHFLLESITCAGNGSGWKSFFLPQSKFSYMMVVHYDSLKYGYFYTRAGKRVVFSAPINVSIFGLSYGLFFPGPLGDRWPHAYGSWLGSIYPTPLSIWGDIMEVGANYPIYVRLS